jgi:hypothetical protein
MLFSHPFPFPIVDGPKDSATTMLHGPSIYLSCARCSQRPLHLVINQIATVRTLVDEIVVSVRALASDNEERQTEEEENARDVAGVAYGGKPGSAMF